MRLLMLRIFVYERMDSQIKEDLRQAISRVVPTFYAPELLNRNAEHREMQTANP